MSERERIKELRRRMPSWGGQVLRDGMTEALEGWERALDERDEARDLVRRCVTGLTKDQTAAFEEAYNRLRAWDEEAK